MRPVLGLLSASILMLVVVACHDPESVLPTQPMVPSLSSADFVAPASIAPGQSVQLVATARLSDGPTKTAFDVVWRTNVESALLQVSATGVLTAGQLRGEGIVTADVTVGTVTRRAQRTMLVMPDGTFRIVGTVTDGSSPFQPIAGARVEVAPGGLSAITDSAGQYRLYGVPPVADLQVTAAGYEPMSRHVAYTANATENFQVQHIVTPPAVPTLSGNYTLAITSPGGCTTQGFPALPTALRQRTYDATVTQDGNALVVVLSGANFWLKQFGTANHFSGEPWGPAEWRFSLQVLSETYYYNTPFPSVAEVLPDGTYLLVVGIAMTSVSASGLSGPMIGAGLVQWSAKLSDPSAQIVGMCASDLQFALTRK
jgi:hypothetical protein